MKRILVTALVLLAALALPGLAGAAECSLAGSKPLWVDYGAPELKEVFSRPGVIVAGSGETYPAEMRAGGAQTIAWDMYLNRRVGTPTAPADPGLLEARAKRYFDFAVLSAGCSTPWIAMNELFGASTATPWTVTNARYRANVLQWARLLASYGGKPILLVSSKPFTGGDAGQWWRDLAQVADIVLEKYFSAPVVHRAGPVLGSRNLRAALRRSAAELFAIGIPPSKLGFMFGFQTKRGAGGREGLEPDSAWFEVAKLQALAAKQVAQELAIAHIWSWGWGHFSDTATADEDKAGAACAWLWARDPALCDAPAVLGDGFDAARTEGQIDLPPGVRCILGAEAITYNQIGELARLTGDAEVAFSALWARAVESRAAAIATDDVLRTERAIVRDRFGGNRDAYLAALARGRATLPVARAAIADQLRRIEIGARLAVAAPSAAEVAEFYATYADVPLAEIAGATLVPDSGPETPLGALPLELVRPTIVRALRAAARATAFYGWTIRRQHSALAEARCVRDRLPAIAGVELTSYLPILAPTGGD